MKIRILISFIVVLMLAACEFEDQALQYDLGNDFVNDPARVILVDTLTVNTYTTVIDSFYTSRASRFLTGIVKNKLGIETYCECYFRLDVSEVNYFHKSAQYDSVSFIFTPDGYKNGDTTKISDFEIYRLTQDMTVNAVTKAIYNTQQFVVEPTPIGKFSIDLNQKIDSVVVPFPDALGEKLFDMYVNDHDSIIVNKKFKDFFKGIAIKPVKNNASFVLGINGVPDSVTSPKIRIYYHDNTLDDNLYIDIPIENYTNENDMVVPEEANYYSSSYIKNNYDGTILSGINQSVEPISSNQTNNVSYLQAGLNLRTRIEIPTIDDLYPFGIGSIIKAELLIEPVDKSYEVKSDLPSMLQMTLVDSKNRYFSPLYVVGSTQTIATGRLNFNKEFKNQTYYSYDITSYVKDEYDSKADPKYALMMNLPFSSKYPTIDQLIIGNQKNTDNKMKLKVYITNY